MKNLIKIFLIAILTLFIQYSDSNSQSQYGFDCGFIDSSGSLSSSLFGSSFTGLNKPIRTDLSGDTLSPYDAVFPVIVVFVQFKGDVNDWQWPTGQAPIYLDSMIAQNKSYNSDWWDAYNENTQPISDYWLELSRGKFHVTGKAFSVVLEKYAYEYTSEHEINLEIWRKLKTQGLTNWQPYDKWRDTLINNEKKFYYQPDGYVDMIYKIHKNNEGPLPNYRGYAHLTGSQGDFSEVLVDTTNNVKVGYGFRGKGSGVTFSWTSRKHLLLSVIPHEHGHCLYANGHITYGKVSYGPGGDGYFSPYEMILLKYQQADTVNFSTQANYYLADYSARNTSNGEILRVPVQGEECFLISNRGNASKWDKIMLGDTTQIIGSFEYGGNYSKGVYIYHVKSSGIIYPNGYDILAQDLECADGVWYWSNKGPAQRYSWDAGYCYTTPRLWPVYTRDSVSYSNDQGWNLSPADGRSHDSAIWAGIGKINETEACLMGTDRIFTNSTEIYSNEEVNGDRYDAWRPGYNEVFSPYSSPSTKTMSNSNSGIFIWLYSNSGSGPTTSAAFNIYKAGVGEPISVDSALHLTPPSRPMGLYVLPCDSLPETDGYKRVKIRWNQNQEPDMNRINGSDTVKRYIVYRSIAANMSQTPPDALAYSENVYQLLDTVDILTGALAEYTDTVNSICTQPPVASGEAWTPYPVRYRVQAVDKYQDKSVLSDFASTQGWNRTSISIGPEEEDGLFISENPEIPNEFALSQNYPNPFNPVTKIKYYIPIDGNVSIKIFDISGRLINILVNEYKVAGRFETDFHGENLSSGVYYYRIESGEFCQVKKMILIK